MARNSQTISSKKIEDRDFLGALARGLEVLLSFDANHRQMTLSDVSKITNLPRATVRRALYTLQQLGYVNSSGRLFRLSPGVLRLATAYLASNSASAVLQPACERICRKVEETCSVGVLDGQDVVIVARASPSRATAIGIGIGYRIPAAFGALGRSILSALPDEDLDAFVSHLHAVRYTPRTPTDKKAILRGIVDVRKRGYAFSDEEVEVGYRSVAVPLRSYDGRTIAAIHIGALAERVSTKKMLNEFLPVLQQEAAALAKQLI